MPSSPSKKSRVAREPNWRPEQVFTSGELPQAMRYWLLDDSSLTSRLIALGRGVFSVARLAQDWQVPLPSEQRLLDIPHRELALVREVVLKLDERPVVFARSVFPLSALTGSLAHLRRLENKPLGAILFRHPGMHRSPFELADIAGDSIYLPLQLHQDNNAWGRRSRFSIRDKALMVSEVFLQGFTPWASTMAVHRTQRGKVTAAKLPPKQ